MGEQLKIDGVDVQSLKSKLTGSADNLGTFEVGSLDNKTTLTANRSGRGAVTLISKSTNLSKKAFCIGSGVFPPTNFILLTRLLSSLTWRILLA